MFPYSIRLAPLAHAAGARLPEGAIGCIVKGLTDGTRPDGTKLLPFMPIEATKQMTETEMQAVWNYLRSLPPRDFGSR